MSAMLEAAARAVATATGYHYSGDSIIENAEDNPRSAHFVAVARAVIDVVLPIEREACAKIARDKAVFLVEKDVISAKTASDIAGEIDSRSQ